MAPSPAPLERTLAVLFAPENLLASPHARRIVTEAGFFVASETDVSGEELEEAGLDLGLGVGDDARAPSDTLVHTVWALERANAVAALKDVKARALADECPNLRVFAAPSGAAADMALDVLFPSLPLLSAQSPVPVAFPVSAAATEDKAKPFALSNLAFSAVQDATPTKPTTRQLSPSIEKALAELEQREEHERLRKASRSSLGSATSPATLRNASPMSAKDAPGQTPPIQGERRVFTARTPEPSDDEAEEVEEVLNLHAEQVPDPPRAVAAPQAGEAAEEAAPAPSSSIVSATATPSLSRTASVASVASLGSSGASFRARPAPSARPTIEPRMTKAAALRLGISLPPSTPRRSVASTSNASAVATPAQAPARRTSVVATPRSLAKPSITPRMTKAASLRTKAEPAELEVGRKGPRAPPQPQVTAKKRQSISTAERAAMDRLARRHSVATAPAAGPAPAPQVQVRMSRTALLRQGVTPAPPACAAPSPAPALASMPLGGESARGPAGGASVPLSCSVLVLVIDACQQHQAKVCLCSIKR